MHHLPAVKAFMLRRKYYIAGALVLVAVALFFALRGTEKPVTNAETLREVRVGRVADLMNGGASLSLVGKVESRSEASIGAESGGRITRVNISLGSRVGAGQIIAEIENSSQRAALQQAQGALDAVKAAVPNYASSLASAKDGAVTTLLSAYAAMDNAVLDTGDQMFSNPEGTSPQFNVSTADSQAKLDLQNARSQIGSLLSRHKSLTATLSASSELEVELSKTESELRTIRTYLDTMIRALNAGVSSPSISESAISTYKAEAAAARTSITGSLSAIAGARTSIETARNNAEGTGGLSATSASLKQAEGAYNAALANLEKTRIRSPIVGTVNNVSIKLGDYVSPTQQVAIVANNGSLEVVLFLTEEDRARIVVGQKVTLENGQSGTITKIAPALDPVTGRIEVRVGLGASAAASLTNGQSVRVELIRDTKATTKALSVPITALKMESDRALVFVVEDGTLVAREIVLGKLSGEYVQVASGIDADTEIIADARGLKEGQQVTISNNQ